jgi:hypothetical protein
MFTLLALYAKSLFGLAASEMSYLSVFAALIGIVSQTGLIM